MPGKAEEWEKFWVAAQRQQLEEMATALRKGERSAGVQSKFTSGPLQPEQLGAAALELRHLRDPRMLNAWKKWVGAAKRFRGLGKYMQAEREMRNIRLSTGGYQVIIKRNNEQFSRFFGGFSEAALQRAMEFRDALLAEAPRPSANPIPREVLEELGLSEPVFAVSHCPERSCFRVSIPPGRAMRNFYYRRVSQADAYAAAIEFREELLAHKFERQSESRQSSMRLQRLQTDA